MREGLLKFYVLHLFGVEVLVLFFWYALNDKRLCFLLVNCIFQEKVILIITEFFAVISVRVLTC